MPKALQVHTFRSDATYLRKRQLSRKRHAISPKLATPPHTTRVMDIGLRRYVALDMRPQAPHLSEHAPILNDEGVCPQNPRAANKREHARQLVFAHHNVNSCVDPRACQMSTTTRISKRLRVKALRSTPRVERLTVSTVDGISPCGERRIEFGGPARRSQ